MQQQPILLQMLPYAKIMLHCSRGGNSGVVTNFAKNIASVDYDVLGLSYYSFFTSHKTLKDLKSNIQTYNGLVYAAQSLVDDDGNLYSGLTTTTYDEKTCIAPTIENQANAVRAIMNASVAAGASGLFYWGGDAVTGRTMTSAMENQTFFDFDNGIAFSFCF